MSAFFFRGSVSSFRSAAWCGGARGAGRMELQNKAALGLTRAQKNARASTHAPTPYRQAQAARLEMAREEFWVLDRDRDRECVVLYHMGTGLDERSACVARLVVALVVEPTPYASNASVRRRECSTRGDGCALKPKTGDFSKMGMGVQG